MRVPSVAGVDAAGLPSLEWYASSFFAGASALHASFPSERLYAIVYSFPSSKAVITSLSPATMGEESPLGAGTFHFTFLSGPNSMGGFALSAIPDPLGPRSLGHASDLSAACPSLMNTPNDINTMVSFMLSSHSFSPGSEGSGT